MKHRLLGFGLALLLALGLITVVAARPPDPGDDRGRPAPQSTPVPQPTSVQLPCVGCDNQSGGAPAAPAAEPAQPAAPADPVSTGPSSDVSKYNVAPGDEIAVYWGPGSGFKYMLGTGAYGIDARGCFAGTQKLEDCEREPNWNAPNWWHLPEHDGWVTNGYDYPPAEVPAAAPAAPAAAPAVSGSVTYDATQHIACYPEAGFIYLGGTATLTGADLARLHWVLKDGGITTQLGIIDVQNGVPFSFSVEMPGLYNQGSFTLVLTSDLKTTDGAQLAPAPTVTLINKCETLGPGEPDAPKGPPHRGRGV